MKLHSTGGSHAQPREPMQLPTISAPKWKTLTRAQILGGAAAFTVLSSAVLFLPAAGADPAELPAPTPTIVAQQVHSPAPVIQERAAETMTDTQRLAVGIYTVIHGHRVTAQTAQMVGEVILNRVDSRLFPDTLDGVLRQAYQFGDLSNGYSWNALSQSDSPDIPLAYAAAEAALAGSHLLPTDTLYVSDVEQGILAAFVDGLYFGR